MRKQQNITKRFSYRRPDTFSKGKIKSATKRTKLEQKKSLKKAKQSLLRQLIPKQSSGQEEAQESQQEPNEDIVLDNVRQELVFQVEPPARIESAVQTTNALHQFGEAQTEQSISNLVNSGMITDPLQPIQIPKPVHIMIKPRRDKVKQIVRINQDLTRLRKKRQRVQRGQYESKITQLRTLLDISKNQIVIKMQHARQELYQMQTQISLQRTKQQLQMSYLRQRLTLITQQGSKMQHMIKQAQSREKQLNQSIYVLSQEKKFIQYQIRGKQDDVQTSKRHILTLQNRIYDLEQELMRVRSQVNDSQVKALYLHQKNAQLNDQIAQLKMSIIHQGVKANQMYQSLEHAYAQKVIELRAEYGNDLQMSRLALQSQYTASLRSVQRQLSEIQLLRQQLQVQQQNSRQLIASHENALSREIKIKQDALNVSQTHLHIIERLEQQLAEQNKNYTDLMNNFKKNVRTTELKQRKLRITQTNISHQFPIVNQLTIQDPFFEKYRRQIKKQVETLYKGSIQGLQIQKRKDKDDIKRLSLQNIQIKRKYEKQIIEVQKQLKRAHLDELDGIKALEREKRKGIRLVPSVSEFTSFPKERSAYNISSQYSYIQNQQKRPNTVVSSSFINVRAKKPSLNEVRSDYVNIGKKQSLNTFVQPSFVSINPSKQRNSYQQLPFQHISPIKRINTIQQQPFHAVRPIQRPNTMQPSQTVSIKKNPVVSIGTGEQRNVHDQSAGNSSQDDQSVFRSQKTMGDQDYPALQIQGDQQVSMSLGEQLLVIKQYKGHYWWGLSIINQKGRQYYTNNAINFTDKTLPYQIMHQGRQMIESFDYKKQIKLYPEKIALIMDWYKEKHFIGIRHYTYYRNEPFITRYGFNITVDEFKRFDDILSR